MNTDSRNDGHGHVTPRPDGYRSRCGGLAMCVVCQRERAALEAQSAPQVALSTLTDELAISHILAAKEDSPAGKWLYDFAKAIERRAASAPAQQAGQGWKLVPEEPTTAMVSAMACSQARDSEGQFPSLMDLIDYSGENKTHTVLKAAYQSMIDAAPPQPVAEEGLSEERILHLWETNVGDPTPSDPLTDGDKVNFARSVLYASTEPARPVAAEVATAPKLLLERAAQMCEWYAEFIRENVMSQDIERHPYLPELEGVAVDLRALAGTGSDESGENGNG